MAVTRYGEEGPGPHGSVMTVAFTLNGNEFVALNGGPQFKSRRRSRRQQKPMVEALPATLAAAEAHHKSTAAPVAIGALVCRAASARWAATPAHHASTHRRAHPQSIEWEAIPPRLDELVPALGRTRANNPGAAFVAPTRLRGEAVKRDRNRMGPIRDPQQGDRERDRRQPDDTRHWEGRGERVQSHGREGGAQNPMNGRKGNTMARQESGNMRGNRAPGVQNGRNLNNRGSANWQQHGTHANYRVRNSREVFRNYRPIRHDRIWYTSRYDRVVIVGGGYYYWDAGYWYPAWGYDPSVSFYVYDGPIYSYDNLPPDQVTVNVQTELQDEGYYTGDVDGEVGPKTRDALGAYQADHDLEVTSAVDEPTVEALGLTG